MGSFESIWGVCWKIGNDSGSGSTSDHLSGPQPSHIQVPRLIQLSLLLEFFLSQQSLLPIMPTSNYEKKLVMLWRPSEADFNRINFPDFDF